MFAVEIGTECIFAFLCPCIYAIPASVSTGEENSIWGYVNLNFLLWKLILTSRLQTLKVTCLTGYCFGTALPFFIVRQSVREKKGIKVDIIL